MESLPGIGGRDAPLSRSPAVRKALSRNLNALPETRKVRGSETLIPHAKGNPFSKDLRIRRISDQKEATSGSNSPRTQIAINVVKQECPTGRDQRQPRATSGTQFQNAPRFSLSLFLCHLDKSLPRLRFTPAPPQPTPNSSAKSVKGTGMEEKTTLTGRCIQDAEKKHYKTSSSVLTGFFTAQRISSLQRALGAPFREADRGQRQRKLSPNRQKFFSPALGESCPHSQIVNSSAKVSARCNGQSFPEGARVATAGARSAGDLGRGSAGPKVKPLSLLSCLPRTPGARLCTLCSSNPPAHSLCLSLELLQRVRKNAPKSFFYTALGSHPSVLFPAKARRSPALLAAGGEPSGGGGGGEQSSPGVLGREDPGIIKGWWAEIRQRIFLPPPSPSLSVSPSPALGTREGR